MISILTILIIVLMSILTGSLSTLGYMIWRMLRSEGWDTSNMTNALRLVSHMVLHPQDFTKMYYLTDPMRKNLEEAGLEPEKPFWYLDKDEFADVVNSRPKSE